MTRNKIVVFFIPPSQNIPGLHGDKCEGKLRRDVTGGASSVTRLGGITPTSMAKLSCPGMPGERISPYPTSRGSYRYPRLALGVFILALIVFLFPQKTKAATDLERIVVVRSPAETSGRGPVSGVLEREDIEKIPAQTPEQLLNYLGGDVQTRGRYGIKSDLSLNASNFQQVLVLVNGMRIKDPQTAHHDLDLFFNLEDVERIEIIPAARSTVYGPDGAGGAINFVLKKPKAEKNSISLSGGNHETFEEKLNLNYSFHNVHNSLSASHAASDGYHFDTDSQTKTFFNSSAFENENVDLYMDAGYNDKEFGAFDFYTPGSNYPSKEWTQTKFLDLRSNLRSETLTFSPRFLFRQHRDKFMLDITNPALFLNHSKTDVSEEGGQLSFPLGSLDMVVGADYTEERLASDTLGKHARGRWDVYLDPRLEINDKTSLNMTLRQDATAAFNSEWTGSVSLKHLMDEKSDGYISLGRTIRIPTFTELYYSDPTTAGDPALKAEHAYHLEAGYNRRLRETINISCSFFIRQEYDTIDFTKIMSTDPKFIARNISEAITGGLDISGRWKVTDKTSLDFRYLYANKRQKHNGLIYKYGVNYLKHMIDLGLYQELPFGSNRVDFIMKKKPGRREWCLVNDRLSVKIQKNCEVFMEVYNLFNVKYEEIVGIPEPDREIHIGTTFRW